MIRQFSFFKSDSPYSKSRLAYGGDTMGREKTFRPLDRRRPLHITLKSSHAKGSRSLLGKKLEIDAIVQKWAQRLEIKIHGFQNVGNHLHLMVSFKSRKAVQMFLRTVTGLIARAVTGARKGKAFGKRFWDYLAHTRIITSRRDFSMMLNYLQKNSVERDSGAGLRHAMEFREDVVRSAKRQRRSLAGEMEERLRRESRSKG